MDRGYILHMQSGPGGTYCTMQFVPPPCNLYPLKYSWTQHTGVRRPTILFIMLKGADAVAATASVYVRVSRVFPLLFYVKRHDASRPFKEMK